MPSTIEPLVSVSSRPNYPHTHTHKNKCICLWVFYYNMEHAALKGRAVCFSRDILLQILPGNRTNYLWCSKKMLAHVITSCHGSWIPFPLRTFLGQVCYVVQLPKYLWFPTMLILPKDSWTNKTHVVYFLLDLIQWFWPHPEKVHAQEKQSKKRAAITKEKKDRCYLL